MTGHEPQAFLLPAEVAAMFGVTIETVRRWARAGKLAHVRTPGGHRRYPADQVEALHRQLTQGGDR